MKQSGCAVLPCNPRGVSALGNPGGGHEPVLVPAFMEAASPGPGQRWVDGTFGRGGHSSALLEAGAEVLALDRDASAEARARELEQRWKGRFRWRKANFSEMEEICSEEGWSPVDGVLLDLGISSPQVDVAERGFSFRQEGPLDMRMDQSQGLTAAMVVNEQEESELSRIFYEFGDEECSRRIARAIVARRAGAPFRTTLELADVVSQAVPARRARGIHPATKVFQALRIYVNAEKEALMSVLPAAVRLLRPRGALAVISFHSGEDKAVKNFMRAHAAAYLDTPRVPQSVPNPEHWFAKVKRLMPDAQETERNPRARSARLRIAWKKEAESGS
jgi:16S rRNA (cytosine1402-N4)-methyltransferase